jgi:hypothetical protein
MKRDEVGCLYSSSCREEVFSETGLDVMHRGNNCLHHKWRFGGGEDWTSISYTGERSQRVTREEIEQRFADVGWELDGSFADHLVIGYSGDHVSLLAHEEVWGTDDPFFEILDHEQMINYWITEIPSPQQAEKLVREYGKPPEVRDRP